MEKEVPMYGIYNRMKKEFQFNIRETSRAKACRSLYRLIGKDAYKDRFEARRLRK